ncbi:MAG: hypothetical protein WA666_11120, partial [Nitrospirota bacterium]
ISFTLLAFGNASAGIKTDMDAGLPLGQVLGNALRVNRSDENVSSAIEAMVKNGSDVMALMDIAFGSGLNGRAIVRGAIRGGGNLETIIDVTLKHGMNPYTIANCCKESGANPERVAAMLAGYTSDDTYMNNNSSNCSGFLTLPIPVGGGGGGGGDVSRSR